MLFLEFGKDHLPTVLAFPGNAWEILISVKNKIPKHKDETFPSIPNAGIWRPPGEGSKSPRLGLSPRKSGRRGGREEAGKFGRSPWKRGWNSVSFRIPSKYSGIVRNSMDSSLLESQGRSQGWEKYSMGDLPGKGEWDP